MVENIILRTSYSQIPGGKLKSNFGDLLRVSVLTECIGKDFLWLTDKRSINLLKYFIDKEKIISIDDIEPDKNFNAINIYNLDNYISTPDLFNRISGNWRGYIPNKEILKPENKLIEAISPYKPHRINKSLQELIVEGLGFTWKGQDYPFPKTDITEFVDIGLNWSMPSDWKSKTWPREYWNELEEISKKDYTISWQEGLDNIDDYVHWLSSCKIIITGETLGLHLASALRKKVLAILGPMKNTEFPYNRLTRIYPAERDCMPCDSPICNQGENCLNEIKPQQIKKIIDGILST